MQAPRKTTESAAAAREPNCTIEILSPAGAVITRASGNRRQLSPWRGRWTGAGYTARVFDWRTRAISYVRPGGAA